MKKIVKINTKKIIKAAKAKPATKISASKIVASNIPARLTMHDNVLTSNNDNIARAFANYVPDKYKGTDKYLDIVQWNIEWFGASKSAEKDKKRKEVVLNLLKILNADLFIFQEVAGPSADGRYKGSLDDIAEELTVSGAGDYAVYYNKAGGEQRVAMMWDREFVRAKSEVTDLFPKHTYRETGQKDPFAERTPLYGYFTTATESDPSVGKFDFQAIGVHLKAMDDGAPQRLRSAEVLSDYIHKLSAEVDADVLIMGDFNANPTDACWKPFHKLEKEETAAFASINDPSEYSYLWLRNTGSKYVSRIDLSVVTTASLKQVVDNTIAKVVNWQPIEEAIARAGNLTDRAVRDVLAQIKENISDHLPTITRFYFDVKK